LNQVRIQSAAAADVAEAASWYEDRRAGLGIEFILELDAAIDRASDTPEIYEVIYLNARRVFVRRFPYSVYFVFDGGIVEVFAVLHQHQTPRTWRSRV